MRKVGKTDYYGRDRVRTVNKDPSMVVQSDAHLADIQNILKSYGQMGAKHLDEAELQFRDVSHFTDLADALNQAREAEVEFMKLPSKVRGVFGGDVAQWLDTAHDQDKRDELEALGFLKPEKTLDVGGGSVDSGVTEPVADVEPGSGDKAGGGEAVT